MGKFVDMLANGGLSAIMKVAEKTAFTLHAAGDVTFEISSEKLNNAKKDGVTHYKAGRIWRVDAPENFEGAGVLYHFLQYAGDGKFISQMQVRDKNDISEVISQNYELKHGQLFEVVNARSHASKLGRPARQANDIDAAAKLQTGQNGLSLV